MTSGLQAGRQGRRQPRRGQHRHSFKPTELESFPCARRAVRLWPRLHVPMPAGSVTPAAFARWIHEQQKKLAPATEGLPSTHHIHTRTDKASRNQNEHDKPKPRPPPPARSDGPCCRRLLGFNLLTAVILGVGGYYFGWWDRSPDQRPELRIRPRPTRTTSPLLLGYFFGVVGFLTDSASPTTPSRACSDDLHRYGEGERGDRALLRPVHRPPRCRAAVLVGSGCSSSSGPNAMLIRTELLHPVPTFVGPGQYLSLVGMHAR